MDSQAASRPRRGRGKSRASLDLIDAAHAILEEVQPATIRQVCYQLFVAQRIASMAKADTNRVSVQLTYAREHGLIPWEWIVDETREAERIAAWDDPEALIQAAVAQYRKDYWKDQPREVEIWSEKGTVRGTLAPVLREWGVTFRVMHGYGSTTAVYEAAQHAGRSGRPFIAIYVGDWDPSGLHMSAVDLPERLKRYGGRVMLRRLAITEADTKSDLPSFAADSKKADGRYRWFIEHYGTRCWELDALPPPDLRARVHDYIADLVDMDRWQHARMVEAAETESLRGVLGNWRQTISGQACKYSDEVRRHG